MEDKYRLYEGSVQNPENDVDFVIKTYKTFTGKKPKTLREDFCGTGYMCCEWVKTSKDTLAYGVDLDPVPLSYGRLHHIPKLQEAQKKRVFLSLENVLQTKVKADCIVAFNFSYYIFKNRESLLTYFKSVRDHLNKDGMFFIDLFGGTECFQELEEDTKFKDFTYYWDCQKFNPITHEVFYAIHYKYKGVKYKNVYTYDWRHWTMPELIDLMQEAGFKKTTPYMEGLTKAGRGNGIFKPSWSDEQCESWVAYLVGQK
jgi:hypothetical protein